MVDVETIKREVIKANHVVKSHLLGLPSRVAVQLTGMNDARLIERLLRDEITSALNGLAYGFGAKDREESEQQGKEEATP